MATLRFDVTHPDGTSDVLLVGSDRILIGTAAHCELRLAVGAAASEHVAIEVVGGALRVVARAFDPAPTLNGNAVTDALVDEHAVLGIGATTIRISPADVAQAPAAAVKREGGGGAVRVIGLVAVAAIGSMLMLRAVRKANIVPTDAPELWPAAVATCPVTARGQARAMGAEKRVVADGKRERHPFFVSDGVEAVTTYEVAAACFRVAGDAPLADELTATARKLRDEVNDDYRVRRLRLERALAHNDKEIAGREVVALRALVTAKQGAYVEWVHATARKLEVDKDVNP